MIDASFIQKIEELAKTEIITVDGRNYSSKKLSPITEPTPGTMSVSTLTGLAEYINENPDAPEHPFIVHIASHENVSVYSPLHGPFLQRSAYLAATAKLDQFPFDRYLDLESFIIALQAKFVQDETTAALLALAGNITGDSVSNYNDDGVTQKVTAKRGISFVGNVPVPNPVTLAPFRTFLEIDQPASRFVYRMKQTDSGIACALIEADGGNWKLEAIKRIRDWLREKLPEGSVILA
ncbi:MAG: hypothetical protein A4E69_01062 [Syntrophus sp. PtaB.Bin138]|nr:MAG: hypothetical protein A4E69_01062 [Syntrophus sp. PtaB.Bin138]